ncbi:MAG: hypothetical protein QXY40_08345 [Candidatus Methanomethylicia archaeon]
MKSPSELFRVEIINDSRYYVCMVCGRRYAVRSGIVQHVKRKHLNMLKYGKM